VGSGSEPYRRAARTRLAPPIAVTLLALAAATLELARAAGPADLADGAAEAPVGRSERLRLSLGAGEDRLSGEIDLIEIPAADGGRRLIVLPLPGGALPGLPLSSILIDASGRSRPDLCDLVERRVVDAITAWFDARGMLAAEWWTPGSAGSERVRLPKLLSRSPVALRRACAAGPDGKPVLELTLEAPVRQDGALRTELRELAWRFVGDGAGGILRAELRHELVRAIETVEEIESAAIAVESLSATPLDTASVLALAREYELLATATRRLLPGGSAEVVTSGGDLLASHRGEFPEGRLAAVVPVLEALLAKRSGELAGGTPDERAEKLIGHAAPDFRLDELDGAAFELASLRGKPVVLSFWGYT